MPSPEVIPFAIADHRLMRGKRFGIRVEDMARHIYVLGKTGAGKTALLENLAVAEIRAGNGLAVLDPHGDLAERLLDLVPRRRLNDVVFFDPAATERPLGLNLLEHRSRSERTLVASGVLSTFEKIFHASWGVRLEHTLRSALLTMLDVPDATLLGVMRILVDDQFRARIVDRLQDPVLRMYWTVEFARYPPTLRAEVIAPVQNKLAAILTSPVLRNIVGQPRSTFSCRALMDEGRILIANLSKGRVGEDAAALLGSVLTNRFLLAAYSRAEASPETRRPFTLYVDEFPMFTTSAFGSALSETRKYGLALVLAHQYLRQLDDELRAAVMGNVGTVITFSVGAEDAEILGKEFSPELTAHDLTRLGSHQIAIRLAVEGTMSRPFTAVTMPPVPSEEHEGHAETIRRISAERYGRPRADVEDAVRRQLGKV